MAELRAAADRGVDRFMALLADRGLAPIRNDPAFVEFIRELAGRYIQRTRDRGASTQAELRVMAHAHIVREEYSQAAELLESALRAGGPQDQVVRAELAALRTKRPELGGETSEARRDGGRHQPEGP